MNLPPEETDSLSKAIRNGASMKTIAFRWLEYQGVSTVILLLLLFGVYRIVPTALEQIQSGYDRNAASLNADCQSMEKLVIRMLDHMEQEHMRAAMESGVLYPGDNPVPVRSP